MITQHSNLNFASGKPKGLGDILMEQDRLRDFAWLWDRVGALFLDIVGGSAELVSGGVVTQGGTFSEINVTTAILYAPFSVTLGIDGNNPPGTGTEDITSIRISLPAQTNFSIAGATLDGVTVNYVKVKYSETENLTRPKLKATGTWAFTQIPSAVLTCDAVAPTSYEVAIATLVGDGTSVLTITQKYPLFRNLISSVSYASKSSNIAAEVNSKYILALNTDLTLPATASEGDVIEVAAIGHSNILQSDAEHVITYRGLYKTSSKGTPGFAALYGCNVNLIFKGAGGSLLAGPVKIADPATLPAGNGNGAAFSPDGRYLAVAETSSPYVIIYDWITGSPVKIADPATLPAGTGRSAAFSPDGRYLAIAHVNSPYITIYDWITGSPVKIANPATLPAGDAYGAAFSPDGRYLAIADYTSPYITIYDWITGSPVKIANPATLPAGGAVGAAFSPDGRYLAIANDISTYITIYQIAEAAAKAWMIDKASDGVTLF